MNNSDEPSNINKENIHNLLSEIEDMNKFQSKIQHNIHEILNLCDLIDSINCDLNNFNKNVGFKAFFMNVTRSRICSENIYPFYIF